MINFKIMPAIYWSDETKISYLQRRILVYSIMYYEHNESCVSDKYFDSICKQLLKLQKNKEAFKSSQYCYAFKDFDGNTGFDLYYKLSEEDKKHILKIINHVRQFWKKEGREVKL